MTYIGIDPGKKGAFAIIAEKTVSVFPYEEDSFVDQMSWLYGIPDCICALEKVHSMPKQGVSSTFSFGENFGFIQGVLKAFSIPFELVPPQKWKREFSVTAEKKTSIEACMRRFPMVKLRRTPDSKRNDDGMAEALLIAEYARRHFK